MYDLVVIGGGINGAGVARDASRRGLKVLLLERKDFGYGTSGRSTKMIHGGLRYLANYEFGIVRESLREREVLLDTANHLVSPLAMFMPVYRGDDLGPFSLRLGMMAYDWFSFDKSLPKRTNFSAKKAIQEEPMIRTEGLRAAARYYDCQVPLPERLIFELLLDASAAGAEIRNYAEVTGFKTEDNRVTAVIWREEDGKEHISPTRFTANLAGPWVDDICQMLTPGAPSMVTWSKGSHIFIPALPESPDHALVTHTEGEEGGFLLLPWRDIFMVGLTDDEWEGDLDDVQVSVEEANALLAQLNRLIPAANVEREDILYAYSGVRPLFRDKSQRTVDVSRKYVTIDHLQQDGIDGVITIVGGKLTTFRSLAESVVSRIAKRLKLKVAKCDTKQALLPGAFTDGASRDEILQRVAEIVPTTEEDLREQYVSVYGRRAPDVVEYCMKLDKGLEWLDEDHNATFGMIAYAMEHEWAVHLADAMVRRTQAMNSPDPSKQMLAELTSFLVANNLLRAEQVEVEIQRYIEYLNMFKVVP